MVSVNSDDVSEADNSVTKSLVSRGKFPNRRLFPFAVGELNAGDILILVAEPVS